MICMSLGNKDYFIVIVIAIVIVKLGCDLCDLDL